MTLGMRKEDTLKLVETVTTRFFGKWTTKSTEGKDPGTPDDAMHRLHICCTMRANGSFAIRGNTNFSAAECGKAIMGNLRNVPHLISANYPLTTFRILQSAKYPLPLGLRVGKMRIFIRSNIRILHI